MNGRRIFLKLFFVFLSGQGFFIILFFPPIFYGRMKWSKFYLLWLSKLASWSTSMDAYLPSFLNRQSRLMVVLWTVGTHHQLDICTYKSRKETITFGSVSSLNMFETDEASPFVGGSTQPPFLKRSLSAPAIAEHVSPSLNDYIPCAYHMKSIFERCKTMSDRCSLIWSIPMSE